MRLSQGIVQLQENSALLTLLGANETDHESLLNAETKNTFDVGTDDLQVHEADHAVLEQISGNLVNVLALVLELLVESLELDSLSFPSGAVIHKGLGGETKLAAGLDHILCLGLVDDRSENLV